jgi:hypothetical protein
MRSWFDSLLETVDRLVVARVSEGMREVGVLWFVFALLDKLVAEQMTAEWLIVNTFASGIVWYVGVYIEWESERSRR